MNRLLTACCVLWMFGAGMIQAETKILAFDFENDETGTAPAGWELGDAAAGEHPVYLVSDAVAHGGLQSFFLSGPLVNPPVAKAKFESHIFHKGKYQLNGSVLIDKTNATNVFPFRLQDSFRNTANSLWFSGEGTIKYSTGTTLIDSGYSYKSDEWYDIEQLVNEFNNTWGFVVRDSGGDDVASGEDLDYSGFGRHVSLDRLSSSGSAISSSSYHIDDVELVDSSVSGDIDGDDLVGVEDVELLKGRDFDRLRRLWVETINTYFGDSNLDGEFNSGDLITVFQAGEYEDGIDDNSTWAEGDWNGDGDFNTGDLVFVFREGGYEKGPRTAVAIVPEPSSIMPLLLAVVLVSPWISNNRST